MQDILVADEHAPPTSTSDFCETKSSFNLVSQLREDDITVLIFHFNQGQLLISYIFLTQEERIDLITAVCHLFREAASLAGSNNTS